MRLLLALALLLGVTAQSAAVDLRADFLDVKDTSKVLFKFEKSSTKKGDEENVVRKYVDLEGKVLAEEKLLYKAGKVIKLELDHKQIDQAGSLEVEGDTLKFSYSKDGKTKTDTEKLDGKLVTTDEIYGFLNANWEKLMAGESLSIRLPVLDRQETVGFKFSKEKKEGSIGDQKTLVVKMKPSSFVIASLVDPVFFHFHPTEMNKEGHKLFQVVGRTVPKRKVDGKWKDLDAVMKFN